MKAILKTLYVTALLHKRLSLKTLSPIKDVNLKSVLTEGALRVAEVTE